MSRPKSDDLPQIDKFKEAARELKADDSEQHFDEKLKRVAKAAQTRKSGPKG
jgi:hypothetical protein